MMSRAAAPWEPSTAEGPSFSISLPSAGETDKYEGAMKRDVKKARAPEPRAEAPGFSFSLPSAGETDKYEEYEKREGAEVPQRRTSTRSTRSAM